MDSARGTTRECGCLHLITAALHHWLEEEVSGGGFRSGLGMGSLCRHHDRDEKEGRKKLMEEVKKKETVTEH